MSETARDEQGRFSFGNAFWKARSKHGPDLSGSSPNHLWAACMEYIEWVNENPVYSYETVKYMGDATLTRVPHQRPMSIIGLSIFLGVNRNTWYAYRDRDEFRQVCSTVEEMIYQQKLDGAANDFFNANIIARDLGLSDKSDINTNSRITGKMKWQIEIVDPAESNEEPTDG